MLPLSSASRQPAVQSVSVPTSRPATLCSARPAARRSLQLQCSLAAPLKRLHRAKVFWDLDNLNVRDEEHALVVGSRLRRSVQGATGLSEGAVHMALFANEQTVWTVTRFCGVDSDSWQAVLDMLGAQLVTVGLGKNAADLRMQEDMLLFAAEHRDGAAIAVASNDQGFAPALGRCSELGAYTVAVGAYLLDAGCTWNVPPLELPVPRAANAIVAFHPGRKAAKSGAEHILAQRWQQLSGVGRVWPDRELKGVCVDCFDNPGRPFRPHSSSRR